MRNSVSGEVRDHGSVLQVHQINGDILLHRGKWRRDRAGLVARVLLALLLVGCEQYAFSVAGDSTFAEGESFRPLDADDGAITRLVVDKLRLCAAEVVAAPVNCPQRSAAQRIHLARWELLGDPRDGMWVRWHRDRFHVDGTAVMAVDYLTHNGRSGSDVEELRFSTEVKWRGGETRVANVGPVLGHGHGGPGRKRGFELSPEAVADAVGNRFATCMATTKSPLPATCPRTIDTPELTNVHWTLNADPLINPNIEQDDEFGLVRVTASYSATARSRDQDQSNPLLPYTQSGTYAATLVRSGDGTARLLELKHVTS